jgi:hypothetical protein
MRFFRESILLTSTHIAHLAIFLVALLCTKVLFNAAAGPLQECLPLLKAVRLCCEIQETAPELSMGKTLANTLACHQYTIAPPL